MIKDMDVSSMYAHNLCEEIIMGKWLETGQSTVYGHPYQIIHYNGSDTSPELRDINLWCWEQFGTRGEPYDGHGLPHRWYFQNNNFWFRDDFDLAWFKMKWA